MDANQKLNFDPYIVCFYDLLNQRQHLDGLRREPATDTELEKYIAAAKSTVGTVYEFREMIKKYVEGFGGPGAKAPVPIPLTPAQSIRLEQIRESRLQTQFFGDSALLYMQMPTDTPTGMKSLYGLVIGMGITHLLMLSAGVPGRGGIEFGVSVDAFSGEVYGPVLLDAYNLESKVAQWPRIVLGMEYVAFLESLARMAGTAPETRFCQETGKQLLQAMRRDAQDTWYLDLRSPLFQMCVNSIGMSYSDTMCKAIDFARRSLGEAKARDDQKLSERYELLLSSLTTA